MDGDILPMHAFWVWAAFVLLAPGVIATVPAVPQWDCVRGCRPVRLVRTVVSGKSDVVSAAVHGLLFAAIVWLVVLRGRRGEAALAALAFIVFVLLAPGVLLTLPPPLVMEHGNDDDDDDEGRLERRFFLSHNSDLCSAVVHGVLATGVVIGAAALAKDQW